MSTAVENIVLACREKNAGLLSALIAGEVSESQIDALFALGRDVVLKSQAPSVEGDQAAVTIDLEIQRDSGSERVERVWQLARAPNGLWRVIGLPDCY